MRLRSLLSSYNNESAKTTEMNDDTRSDKLMNLPSNKQSDTSDMAGSESNQAHILSREHGQQTPNQMSGSVENLYEPDPRLIELLQQRDSQILEL